jgi:hypothetical protein
MRGVHKLLVLLLMVVLTGSVSVAEEMVIEAFQDAYTFELDPWDNFGAEHELIVGEEVVLIWPYLYYSFIEFDLTQLPAGITSIDEAVLELTSISGGAYMDVHEVVHSWHDFIITWDYQPAVGNYLGHWSQGGYVVTFPITNTADFWYNNPGSNHGIRLSSSDNDYSAYHSSEGAESLRPKLHVTYTMPPAELVLTPSVLTIDWDHGDPSPTNTFDVHNTGLIDLNWALSDDADWMSCTPTSGVVSPGDSQTVTVTADSWPGVGEYTGTITVTDPDAIPTSDIVTVTLNCDQPLMAVDPVSIDIGWLSLGPDPTGSFQISNLNAGTADLEWTLTETSAWMYCDPMSGTIAPGDAQTVTIYTQNWPGEGTFLDSIVVSAPYADPTQTVIGVTITCTEIPLRLMLHPPTDPVIVSPGGNFIYNMELFSGFETTTLTDIWTQALLPNGNTITVWSVNNFPISPNMFWFIDNLSQDIPVTAPIGEYVFYMRAGDYPSNVLAEDSFGVSVTGAARSGGPDDWLADGFGELSAYLSESEHVVATDADAVIPSEFALGAAYPNPFNPSTTLNVSLPETAELSVVVYNVSGQHVATLANGRYDAGSHTLTFDASHLSGGVYFVQAASAGWSEVQKVVLMK